MSSGSEILPGDGCLVTTYKMKRAKIVETDSYLAYCLCLLWSQSMENSRSHSLLSTVRIKETVAALS